MKLPYTLAATLLASAFAVAGGPAGATGTALVQQPDGSTQTYANVSIRTARQELALTTSDGAGTVVLGKAACTKAGELLRCLPYDATLFQNGTKQHIALKLGSVWLNPTNAWQTLPYSSAQVPPRGIVLAVTSRRGTFISLTGKVDEIQK